VTQSEWTDRGLPRVRGEKKCISEGFLEKKVSALKSTAKGEEIGGVVGFRSH